MEKETFKQFMTDNCEQISKIKELAHKVHAAVNQHYDTTLPYSVHLDSVARYVEEYAYEICDNADDILPLMFGAYFHDSIEDARLTYNNVMHLAQKMMTEKQAKLAAEIVYALTNEKGRTRAERANDKYYSGIRSTPYAPLCKIADRLANVTYSVEHCKDSSKPTMRHVYAQENPHFIASILSRTPAADSRMRVPKAMVDKLEEMLKK